MRGCSCFAILALLARPLSAALPVHDVSYYDHATKAAVYSDGGTKAGITIYQGVKHESFNLAWKETELVEWLFAQGKPGQK